MLGHCGFKLESAIVARIKPSAEFSYDDSCGACASFAAIRMLPYDPSDEEFVTLNPPGAHNRFFLVIFVEDHGWFKRANAPTKFDPLQCRSVTKGTCYRDPTIRNKLLPRKSCRASGGKYWTAVYSKNARPGWLTHRPRKPVQLHRAIIAQSRDLFVLGNNY